LNQRDIEHFNLDISRLNPASTFPLDPTMQNINNVLSPNVELEFIIIHDKAYFLVFSIPNFIETTVTLTMRKFFIAGYVFDLTNEI
jgi:hypothetical protein